MVNVRKTDETFSEKQTNITDVAGNPITEITMNIQKTFKTKAVGIEYADVKEKVLKLLKSSHFTGRRKKKEYMVALKFANGWYSGFWFRYPKVHLFNFDDYYPDVDEMFDTTVYGIRIYEKTVRVQAGGKNNSNNDCLYDCLEQSHIYNPFKKPSQLKKYIGVSRQAPIDIKYIPKIEEKVKVNIIVSGDYIYNSTSKFNETIHITLTNGHYQIKGCENIDLLEDVSFRERIIIIHGKDEEGNTWTFDGENLDTSENAEKNVRRGYGNMSKRPKYLPIKHCSNNTHSVNYTQQYQEYYEMAQELKDKTFGKINLFKNNFHNEALRFFHSYIQSLKIEPLEQIESMWIDKAYRGGITYARCGAYENASAYDFVSMYPSCMKSGSFPIKQGEFKTLTEKPSEYWSYGIYRCNITLDNPLVKYSKQEYFTHYDLNIIEFLGGTITLIQDGQHNALLYPTRQNNLFTKYVNELFELKQQGVKGAKLLLNILYGMMAKKNKKQLNVSSVRIVERQEEEILCIRPNEDDSGHIMIVSKINKPFKYALARAVPFITANARLHMVKLIHNQMDKVVRIQTDGCITTSPLNIPEKMKGTGLGQVKQEVDSKNVEIINVNSIRWE